MLKTPELIFRFFPSTRREVATLAVLAGLVVVCFTAVAGLSRAYHVQQESLAERWSGRGAADLKAGNFAAASVEFHTALLYSHDDFENQLGLAQALIGQGKIDEAYGYLVNLWSQKPERGVVNLELARIAAGRRDQALALRYYHNAIYAIWVANPEASRRAARWELIKYQMSLNTTANTANAQAELIALSADVGDDPAEQKNIGEYFLKVDDYPHALASYRICLRADEHNVAVLAGAGTAAFGMGDYVLAQHYLQHAVEAAPGDQEAETKLQTASLALRMDPFRRQITEPQRDDAVRASLETAGNRLQSCAVVAGDPAAKPAAAQANAAPALTLGAAWKQLQPQVTRGSFLRDTDSVNRAMNLVFAIEREATSQCGAGTPADTALTLISKIHEGN
jgi:tetratricopeptide (TPR) repeat protein